MTTNDVGPDEQDAHSYRKFAEMVNEITDPDILNAAEELMNDMAKINNMKQKIQMIEDELHKGKRAVFYFFTLSLSEDEISGAAQTVKGRKRVLAEKAERAKSAIESSEEESDIKAKE
jgi:hypothetical protein